MADHSPDSNLNFFQSPDGSFEEAVLDYLSGMGGVKVQTSTVNASTTLLTSSSTFTGTSELNSANDVMVTVKTDQEGTLYMDFSPDGTNWDSTLSFKYDPNRINPPHILVKGNRYFRVRFTNDSSSDQTYLRLNTYYGSFQKLTASINGTLAENYDAIVARVTSYEHEVAMSKRQGRKTVHSWAHNSDVDTGTEIVADFGGTFNIMTSADTLDVVSSSVNDDAGGTGCTAIIIEGIDENHLYQTETVIMDGITPVTTSNSWLGVNRAYGVSFGSLGTVDGTITIDDTSNAVGTQVIIEPGDNVSHACIYHTQINHNFLIDYVFVNARKDSGGGSPKVTFKLWSYSRVTNASYEIGRFEIDTASENSQAHDWKQPLLVGGREVVYLTATTDRDNTPVSGRIVGIEERVV